MERQVILQENAHHRVGCYFIMYRNVFSYYMALPHKDWELPNSQILLAELDIYCGLDFPSRPESRPLNFSSEKFQTEMQNH